MLSLGNWLKHELARCWLLDLAREVPSNWSLQGFDVSVMQFPVPQNLPDNVSLRFLDAFDDIPENMTSKFDIVHIRAFAVVVKGGDPGPLTKNLVKLLSVFLLIWIMINRVVTDERSRRTWRLPSMGRIRHYHIRCPFSWECSESLLR